MQIKEFLNKYLELELFPEQLEIVEAKAQNVICLAGRGFGKSVALIAKAIANSYFNANHTVLLVSASFRQSVEQLGQQTKELLQDSKLKNSLRGITENKITFSNGSIIYILPPNPATIRGFHSKFKGKAQFGITILMDEACYAQDGDSLRKAIEYAGITAPQGKKQMIICSTPTTYDSWVYELWERGLSGDDAIKCLHYPSWLSPYVDKKDLERAKKYKSDSEYRQEIGAEFIEATNTFFAGIVDKSISKDNLGLYPEQGWSYGAGIDLKRTYTKGKDKSVVLICGKLCRQGLPPVYKVIDYKTWSQHTSQELGDTIKLYQEKYSLEDCVIEHREATGIIEYCHANNLPFTTIDPTSIQREIFGYLHYLLTNQLLTIPKDATGLLEQLKVFKLEMDETGNISFGSKSKRFHDDIVFALGYAIGITDKESRKGFGLARIISTGAANYDEVLKNMEASPDRITTQIYGKEAIGFNRRDEFFDREFLTLPSSGWDNLI